MNFNSVNEILDFAIEKEQDAADFYTNLGDKMAREHMKKVFHGFAKEEMGHKAKLESVKNGKKMVSSEKRVLDLKVGDNLVEVEISENPTYQDALIVAMKSEKNAYMLYSQLAEATSDAEMKDLFLGLAQEEAKHKLRFEVEYDDVILTEN